LRYAAFTAALLIAGCNNQPVEKVTDASVRLPAVAGNPGAAYFTLHGGPANNRLVDVSSPQAIRAEMHDMTMAGGMMKMTQMESGVEVPAGGRVTFKTGGKHVMLFELNPKVKPGDTVKLSLTYANGRVIEVDAKAQAPGGGEDHAH
jgi:hypothetical protein